VNAPHDAETVKRMQNALDFALEASKMIARTVADAVMNGQEPAPGRRYLLSMGWNAETKTHYARVEAVPDNAIIAPLSEFAQMIAGGAMPRTSELADIAKASVGRLKLRHVA
jgi:hypothetical protein